MGDKLEMVMGGSNGRELERVTKLSIPIPIGFRFRPTDEEVLVHYLTPKTLSLPFPASVIPDFLPIFRTDPWSLPGDLREKKYYFGKRKGEVLQIGSKCGKIMATTSGFWKAIGKGKQVISSRGTNDVVGCRKSWAFYQIHKDPSHAHGLWSKTRWFMHEFQLLHSTQDRIMGKLEDNWVVCRVFQKKMRPKNRVLSTHNLHRSNNFRVEDKPNIIDLRMENSLDMGPPQPSSPSC